MSFKDIMVGDVDSVFIDPDEFAEPIFVQSAGFEPQQVNAVVDDDSIQARGSSRDGTFESIIQLFVSEAELGYVPENDDLIYWGRSASSLYPYIVDSVGRQNGVLAIRLKANQA